MSKIDGERELDAWCKCIYDYTKERVENDSSATRWIFDRVTHDEWVLTLFPKHLSSVKAYNEFFELSGGKDIRNYNWNSDIKTGDGKTIKVHKLFVDKHLTTAHDFKYELISLYKNGQLTTSKIKELIFKQRLCWITKAENSVLNAKGYAIVRPDPLKAYAECGIDFYNATPKDLDVFKPTFNQSYLIRQKTIEKAPKITNSVSKIEIFNKLKAYFAKNTFDGKSYIFDFYPNKSYAWIYKSGPFMINLRCKNNQLYDISLFISGANAKIFYDKLLNYKDELQAKLKYALSWDRNDEKKAVRIGRFFTSATFSALSTYNFSEPSDSLIEKTAQELIEFYCAIVPIIEKIRYE